VTLGLEGRLPVSNTGWAAEACAHGSHSGR
jgi:hypothetical protein